MTSHGSVLRAMNRDAEQRALGTDVLHLQALACCFLKVTEELNTRTELPSNAKYRQEDRKELVTCLILARERNT